LKRLLSLVGELIPFRFSARIDIEAGDQEIEQSGSVRRRQTQDFGLERFKGAWHWLLPG
jgi:hypothetical protein